MTRTRTDPGVVGQSYSVQSRYKEDQASLAWGPHNRAGNTRSPTNTLLVRYGIRGRDASE